MVRCGAPKNCDLIMVSSLCRLSFLLTVGRVAAVSALLAALSCNASALPISPSGPDTDRPAVAAAPDLLKQLRDAIAVRPQAVAADEVAEVDGADLPQRPSATGGVIVPIQSTPVAAPARGETAPLQVYADGRDESLGQVLRMIATVDRDDPATGRRRAGGRGDQSGGDSDSLGLSAIVFDSETSAALLRKVIDIKSTDGKVTVFSVLGLGDFVLEVTPGDHTWTIAELSTGWSLPISMGSDSTFRGDTASYSNDADSSPDAATPQKSIGLLRLVRWLREFLLSPFGLLGLLMTSLFVLLWGAAKTIVALERRSLGRRGF